MLHSLRVMAVSFTFREKWQDRELVNFRQMFHLIL